MYLTAHRVKAVDSAMEGVNAFIHGHGPYDWEGQPPFKPEENPGTLYDSLIDPNLPSQGNRVRSYLDVLTPDETPRHRIHESFALLLASIPPERLPAAVVIGPCWFRFAMEESLAANWRGELQWLFERASALLTR